MTFDAVDFLAGLVAPAASPVFDPDTDGGPDPVALAADSARSVPTSPDRMALAGIIREARRDGDRDRAADIRERFAERAAIMQFDGEMDRHEAERCALADVLPRLQEASAAADIEPDPLAGLVNDGWTPRGWRDRLRQLADLCESVRPELAAVHRANADRLGALLEGNYPVAGKSTVMAI